MASNDTAKPPPRPHPLKHGLCPPPWRLSPPHARAQQMPMAAAKALGLLAFAFCFFPFFFFSNPSPPFFSTTCSGLGPARSWDPDLGDPPRPCMSLAMPGLPGKLKPSLLPPPAQLGGCSELGPRPWGPSSPTHVPSGCQACRLLI